MIPSLDTVSQTCRIERTVALTRAEHLARLIEDPQPAPHPRSVRVHPFRFARWLGLFADRQWQATS